MGHKISSQCWSVITRILLEGLPDSILNFADDLVSHRFIQRGAAATCRLGTIIQGAT